MVEHLLSYFFDKPIIASKTRKRSGDHFVERIHMTPVNNSDKKLVDIPLFILTSSTTFSAAEGFSYPLQVYNRSMFIGETTKGGANAGDIISVDQYLEVFIPDVSVTHPITNASWEAIGVIPDIKVDSKKAMETALTHAQKAAKEYKEKNDDKAKSLLLKLDKTISTFNGHNNQLIIDAYLACRKHDLIFEQWELNSLGYEYFSKAEGKKTSEAIFEANTVLYPSSANAFDNYAEKLWENGKKEKALLNYKKAFSLAKKFNLHNVDLFRQNLEKVKEIK